MDDAELKESLPPDSLPEETEADAVEEQLTLHDVADELADFKSPASQSVYQQPDRTAQDVSVGDLRAWYRAVRDRPWFRKKGENTHQLEARKNNHLRMIVRSAALIMGDGARLTLTLEQKQAMQRDFNAFEESYSRSMVVRDAALQVLAKIGKTTETGGSVYKGRIYDLTLEDDRLEVHRKDWARPGIVLIVKGNEIMLTAVSEKDKERFVQLCCWVRGPEPHNHAQLYKYVLSHRP